MIGSETIPMCLYHLYVGLLFNSFDTISLFETSQCSVDGNCNSDDEFAAGLSMTVSATVLGGFISAVYASYYRCCCLYIHAGD